MIRKNIFTLEQNIGVVIELKSCPFQQYLHGGFDCVADDTGINCEPLSKDCILVHLAESAKKNIENGSPVQTDNEHTDN